MKVKKLVILSLFAIAGVFFGCENEELDDTPPAVTISQPVEHGVYHPGEAIRFTASFTDDVELKSYKIDIHNDFDGHSHGRLAHEAGLAWDFNQTWNFEEGQRNVEIDHSEIVVPLTIDGEPITHGAYHFSVFCADAAGNETTRVIEIEIEGEEDHHD